MPAQRVDVCYALISDEDGGRVLLVRNEDTWSLPGGRREEQETLAETAARETKEETGVVVEIGAVVHVSERIDPAVHDVFTVFRARLLSGQPFAGGHDDDVTEAVWVDVPKASILMPWYPHGVQPLLEAPGAGYSVSRE